MYAFHKAKRGDHPPQVSSIESPIVATAVKASLEPLHLKRPPRAAQRPTCACGRFRYSPNVESGDNPSLTVARITAQPQNAHSDARNVAAICSDVSVSPCYMLSSSSE